MYASKQPCQMAVILILILYIKKTKVKKIKLH